MALLLATALEAPRPEQLAQANAAYARHDLQAAVELYQQVAETPADDGEPRVVAQLARFRALIALATLRQDDSARRELAVLVERDPDAALARLAAQFWDQYGMTASVRAACAQLLPQVQSQAVADLATLAALGIAVRPDELCLA